MQNVKPLAATVERKTASCFSQDNVIDKFGRINAAKP